MSTSQANSQVIVVGGGPAGSATAWFCARAGLDVLLLDRASFPRSKPCAEYVSPEAARILSLMGVLDQVDHADSTQLTGMTVVAPSGAQIRGEFVAQHGFRGFRDRGIGCRREIFDTLLLDAARGAGVQVEERTMVTDVVVDHVAGRHALVTGVRVRTSRGDEATYRASVVVGADGLRSIVAARLGLAHRARWPERMAIMAHFSDVRDMSTHGEMFVSGRGYFGVAQVGHNVTNAAFVLPRRLFRALHANDQSPEQMFDAFVSAHPVLCSRFANATRLSPWRVTGPFASRAKRAWHPGAALVGDAADFFDPFTGEGMFAALRGGEILAPFIEAAVEATERGDRDAANHLLAAYDTARRSAFRGKWRVEWLIGLAVSNPWLMNTAARILGRDRELADLLVGVTGDFVPARALLRAHVLRRLVFPVRSRATAGPPAILPE